MKNKQKINAWVLEDLGKISWMEREIAEVGDREVLVAVQAVGICGSDIPRIYQTGAYHYPLVCGHEFSGQVVKTGRLSDDRWLGQRVGVFPLIPCGVCMPCQKKQYEMCRNYSYLGSRRDGGFAELVLVPEKNLIALPENVSYKEAAMLEPMAVAVHAMRQLSLSSLNELDSVVVCGLGTIGMLVLMFLMEAGVKNVLVLGNKEFQKKTVMELGLLEENYCDIRNEDAGVWIAEHTQGMGAQVFFECVGKKETVSLAVASVQPGGEIVLVGNPYSDMELEKNNYWKILRNQIQIHGTWNSSFTHSVDDDWHYVLERLEKGRIAPEKIITHCFLMEELEKGLGIMKNKTEDYCKIMVTVKAERPVAKLCENGVAK